MSATTNIADLPSQVTFSGTEQANTQQPPAQQLAQPPIVPPSDTQHPQLTPQMQTEILSNIQNASRHGGTDLPSRDIPQQTASIVQDPQIKPNYVPPPSQDYIGEYNTAAQAQDSMQRQHKRLQRIDFLFEEFRIPLIIAGLYFLFQLPAVNRFIMKLIPSLFDTDGNITFVGSIAKSALFGVYYYIFAKSMSHLSQI